MLYEFLEPLTAAGRQDLVWMAEEAIMTIVEMTDGSPERGPELIILDDAGGVEGYLEQHRVPSTPPASRTEVTGVARRLQAGLWSFEARGFRDGDVMVSGDQVTIASAAGAWSWRPWVVTATPKGWVVAVGSRARHPEGGVEEMTLWVGLSPDPKIEARIQWILAGVGARFCARYNLSPSGWTGGGVNDPEWHDLHGGVVGEWRTDDGEAVVLRDDDYGCAWLDAPAEARDELVAIGRRVLTQGDDPR